MTCDLFDIAVKRHKVPLRATVTLRRGHLRAVRDTNRLSGVSYVCYGDLNVLVVVNEVPLVYLFFFLIWTKPGYQAFLRGGGEGKIKEQEKEEVKEKGNYLLFSLPCTLLCPPPRMKD